MMSNQLNETFDQSQTTSDRFVHILSAIEDVQMVLRECSLEHLAHDKNRRLALERLIEMIGAAVGYLPDDVKVVESQVDWRTLSDMWVRLENTRERIEPNVLWNITHQTLVPLKACAISRIAETSL